MDCERSRVVMSHVEPRLARGRGRSLRCGPGSCGLPEQDRLDRLGQACPDQLGGLRVLLDQDAAEALDDARLAVVPLPANVRFGMLSLWNLRASRAAQASNTSGPAVLLANVLWEGPAHACRHPARASDAAQATNAPAAARPHPGSAPSHARRRGHTRSRRRCRPSAPRWNAPARYAGRPSSGRSSNCLRSTLFRSCSAKANMRLQPASKGERRAPTTSSSPASSRELVPSRDGSPPHLPRSRAGMGQGGRAEEVAATGRRQLGSRERTAAEGEACPLQDRNPLNDDPSNLQALTRAEHLAEHRDEHRRAHATSPNSVG